MEFYLRFGKLLRQARKAAGLSQADLAVALKLTRTSVSNIEKGRQKVLLHTFGEILHTLNVQPGELLPGLRPTTMRPGLHSLAHDARDFVERGLGLEKEKHGSSLDANPEGSQGTAGEI